MATALIALGTAITTAATSAGAAISSIAAGTAAAGASSAALGLVPGVGSVAAAGTTGISLGSALGIAGTVAGVGGSLLQANAAKRAEKFNQAQLAEQARQEREAAGIRASERRRLASQQISTQTALLAAQGADTTAGQALLFQSETAREGEFAANMEQFQGDRRASTLDTQRRISGLRGRSQYRQGFIRAGGSLLGGVQNGTFY